MKNVINYENGLEIREFLDEYGNGSVCSFLNGVQVGRLHFAIFNDENKAKIQSFESNKKGLHIGTKMIDSVRNICLEKGVSEIYGAIQDGSQGFYEKIGATIGDAGGIMNEDDRKGQPAFKIVL